MNENNYTRKEVRDAAKFIGFMLAIVLFVAALYFIAAPFLAPVSSAAGGGL